MNKEEYLGLLRTHPVFKAVLEKSTNPSERRAIKAHAEEFMMKFFDIFRHMPSTDVDRRAAFEQLGESLLRSGST
jgi:hypothetical protein